MSKGGALLASHKLPGTTAAGEEGGKSQRRKKEETKQRTRFVTPSTNLPTYLDPLVVVGPARACLLNKRAGARLKKLRLQHAADIDAADLKDIGKVPGSGSQALLKLKGPCRHKGEFSA